MTNLPTAISLSLSLSLSLLPLPDVPQETPISASLVVKHSLSFCLSHAQVSGSEAASFLAFVLEGIPLIPLVFRLPPHSYSRCLAPRLASGTRDRRLHTPAPLFGCQMSYHWMVIPHFRVELQLSAEVRHLKTKDLVQDDQAVRKLVKAPWSVGHIRPRHRHFRLQESQIQQI